MSVKASTIFAALKEPFDDDVIVPVSKRGQEFSNVAPHHYIERIQDAAPGAVSVEFSQPVFHGKAAVSVNGKVTFHTAEGDRVFAANGTEPLVDEDGEPTTDPEIISFLIKNAQSDALKLALKPTGLGLDLYNKDVKPSKQVKTKPKPAPVDDEEDEEEPPAPKRRTTSAGGGNKGGWAEKRDKFKIPIGKHKDTVYSKIEAGWLDWYVTNVDREEKNAKVYDCIQEEIAYRKQHDLWSVEKKRGSAKPVRKRRVDEDESDGDTDF